MDSLRGMGLNLNNIANIHRKQKRFIEAVRCYNDALYFCEQEIFVTLPFRPASFLFYARLLLARRAFLISTPS